MLRAFALSVVGVVSLAFVGCGDAEAKKVGSKSQLEGTWLAEGRGPYVGLEFLADGKVLATPMTRRNTSLSSGVMLSYDVLEGGRLTLTNPLGATQVFQATIRGDEMDLSGGPGMSPDRKQRFRRLPSGQTLAEGFKLQREARKAARKSKFDALNAFIEQDGLVIVPVGAVAGGASAVAVKKDASGTKAWHDDKPPHLDVISLVPNLAGDGRPRVRAQYGNQLLPATNTPTRRGPTIHFVDQGDVDNLKLIAEVTYNGKPMKLELKRDPALHDAIVQRFDTEMERIAALKKPLIDALGHFVVIEGTSDSQIPNEAKGTRDRILLVREGGAERWRGEGTLTNLRHGTTQALTGAVATVQVVNDKPQLEIHTRNRRQYQLELADAAAGSLQGRWFVMGRPKSMAATLTIKRSMDRASYAEMKKAKADKLAAVDADTMLFGAVQMQHSQAAAPIAVKLSSQADKSLLLVVDFVAADHVAQYVGRVGDSLTGPRFTLRFKQLDPSSAGSSNTFVVGLRSQRWTFQVAEGDGPLELIGTANNGSPICLVTADKAWKTTARKRLADVLNPGARFVATQPSRGARKPTVIELKLDAGSGGVTGQIVESSRQLGLDAPSAPLTGRLTADTHGWPMLDLVMGKHKHACEIRIVPGPEDMIRLSGVVWRVRTPGSKHAFELELAKK